MRIHHHPILDFGEQKTVKFMFNGQPLEGRVGDTIAAALHAQGIKMLSESIHLRRPRGFYCAIGNCASCNMVVNGEPNVRTCITPLVAGMDVRIQEGKGRIR